MRPLPPKHFTLPALREGVNPYSVKTHIVRRSPPWRQRPQNLTRLFSDVDVRLYQSEQLVLQKRAARQKP
jgi:hypothetical protein